jgi:hypothetical protein
MHRHPQIAQDLHHQISGHRHATAARHRARRAATRPEQPATSGRWSTLLLAPFHLRSRSVPVGR